MAVTSMSLRGCEIPSRPNSANPHHYGEYAVPRMALIVRWIDYFDKDADCCVGSANFDALYRWEISPVSYVAIDTSLFRPPVEYEYLNDGRNGPVTIVHSPNHRVIKGTEYIIAAVEKLKSEGLQIEFQLLEGLKNTEGRALLNEATFCRIACYRLRAVWHRRIVAGKAGCQ